MPDSPGQFPHRKNPDGSCDSICTKCFCTVGTGKTEAELRTLEEAHVCDEAILREREVFHEALVTRRI